MKKTTLIFLTTFFFFVGITTTKAYGEEVSPMLDLSTWNLTYDSPIPDNIKEIALNLVDTQCQDYDHYIISTKVGFNPGTTYTNEKYFIGCFNGSMTKLTAEFTLTTSNYPKNLSINFDTQTGTYTPTYDFKAITLTSNGSISQNTTRNNYFNMSNSDYGSGIPFPQIITDLDGIYFANPVTSPSTWTHYKSVKYNDVIYNLGDKMFNLADSSFVNPDNVFHETLYTTDYNSIEFEFDLASLPLYEKGNTFNLDFTFKSVTQSGDDETIKFSLPYYTLTQLVDSITEEGASITLTKEDVEKYFKQDNYTYTYSNSEQIRYLNDLGVLEKNYTKYKITLPLEFSYASFVDVYVKSNLDFEIIRNYSSSYDETIVSDIKNIDLTNKYGVVFIPLVKNGSIHFPFKSVGHFFVQHRDSYNEDFNILSTTTVGYCDEYHKNDENYTCADLSGLYSFTFKEGFDNQVLTFINRNYENDTNSFVEYHSNSFNYCILDTPTSTCNIINPNTDEEVNLTLKDYFDYKTESNNESFFEMFSNAFNRFKTAILSIFDYISIYFEYLPNILKDFYIVIFVFVILAVIVKFLI